MDILGLDGSRTIGKGEPHAPFCHRLFGSAVFTQEAAVAGQPPVVGSQVFNIPCLGSKCMLFDEKRNQCADRSKIDLMAEANEVAERTAKALEDANSTSTIE